MTPDAGLVAFIVGFGDLVDPAPALTDRPLGRYRP